jgi:hypothetical protein
MSELTPLDNSYSQPLTALIDGQAIYPAHLVPNILRQMYLQALEMSQDALMMGMKRGNPALFWFKGLWVGTRLELVCITDRISSLNQPLPRGRLPTPALLPRRLLSLLWSV